MNELEHNRDPGDETAGESHEIDVAIEHAHAIRLADDPDCICGGGHTVHEANAGGHSSSCPLWGQTWEGWHPSWACDCCVDDEHLNPGTVARCPYCNTERPS